MGHNYPEKKAVLFTLVLSATVAFVGVSAYAIPANSLSIFPMPRVSPYANALYLVPAALPHSYCTLQLGSRVIGTICLGRDISDAVVFKCETAAETLSGCTTTVVSQYDTAYNYNITIWYPYINASLPDVNCRFHPEGWSSSKMAEAWCMSVGPDSFVMTWALVGPVG